MKSNRWWARSLLLLLVGSMVGWASPDDAPLADALMRGDRDAARSLLERGVDVNEAQPDGMTALHWAALGNDTEMTDLLVAQGANLEAPTRLGHHTPLHVAAESGSGAVMERLLAAGANPYALTINGVSALHMAAVAGSVEGVEALLSAGVDPDLVEPTWGETPLMAAAVHNRAPVIRALLAAGADADARARVLDLVARDLEDRQAKQRRDEVLAGFREQHEASQEGEWRPTPEQVQAAVAAAMEVEGTNPEASPQDPDEYERKRLARLESDGGEDDDQGPAGYAAMVGAQGGLSPLLLALRDGHKSSVKALLEGGADPNLPSAGDGTTPMLLAALNGHYDLVLVLLEAGADPNVASDVGATPLYAVLNKEWAPHSRHPQPTHNQQQEATYLETMRVLLEAGADPNVRLRQQLWYTTYNRDMLGVNRIGATPFWRAAYATDLDAMKLLLAHGADPSVPTRKPPERRRGYGSQGPQEDPSGLPPIPVGGPGVYPIHAAAGVGYGLNFAANDHRHVPGGWMRVMRFLVEELDADVNQRDHMGFTPLHHAASRGDNEMIRYLVEKGADVTAIARTGQTTADMANGPVQRVPPFVSTVRLLESLGSANNHNCLSC